MPRLFPTINRLIGLTLALAVVLISYKIAHAQSTSEGNSLVTIISPAEISAQQATQLLFSPTPGVFTITIPGGGSSNTIELTATGVDAVTGTFTFATSGSSVAAMQQLMQELSSGNITGSLTTSLTLSGFINGQGVQIVILQASQNGDGSGSLKATITFD